jgi:hypothetical protein
VEARCNEMGRLASGLINCRTWCRNGMCLPNSSMLWVRNVAEYSIVLLRYFYINSESYTELSFIFLGRCICNDDRSF